MNLNILGVTAVWLLIAQGSAAAGTESGTASAASTSEARCLESVQDALNAFESAVKENAEKFEKCMVDAGRAKTVNEVQNLSDADSSFAGLSSEDAKIMQDFQNVALVEFSKLQDAVNSALKDLPENIKYAKEALEVIKYAAVPCAGCSDSVYRYVLLLKPFIEEVKKNPSDDFSKDVEFFHEIHQKCVQNLRYAPHAIAFGGILPSEVAKKEAEEKAKKEAEEKAKKEAEEKAKKEAEEKAKKEAEEKAKKEAEEAAKKKEAEEKAKKEAEEAAKKKEAEEKAKKEAEEKAKKEAEEAAKKKEAEEAAKKKEAEEKAKKEAEEKAKKEAEEKAKKEAEEAAKKKEAEEKAKKEAEEKAKKTSEFIFRRPDIVKLQKEAEEVVGKVGGVKSKTAFYNLRGELNGLEGKKASEVMAVLEKHLKNLDKNPEAYDKMVKFANQIIEEVSKK